MPLLPSRARLRITDKGSFDLFSSEPPRRSRPPIQYGRKPLIPLTGSQFLRTFYGDSREATRPTAGTYASQIQSDHERNNLRRQNAVQSDRSQSPPTRPTQRKSPRKQIRTPVNELLLIDGVDHEPAPLSPLSDDSSKHSEDPIDERAPSPSKLGRGSKYGNEPASPTSISTLRKRVKKVTIKQRLIKNIRVRRGPCSESFTEQGDGFEKNERMVQYLMHPARKRISFRPKPPAYMGSRQLVIRTGPLPDFYLAPGNVQRPVWKVDSETGSTEQQRQSQSDENEDAGLGENVGLRGRTNSDNVDPASPGHPLPTRRRDTEIRRELIMEQLSSISAPAREPDSSDCSDSEGEEGDDGDEEHVEEEEQEEHEDYGMTYIQADDDGYKYLQSTANSVDELSQFGTDDDVLLVKATSKRRDTVFGTSDVDRAFEKENLAPARTITSQYFPRPSNNPKTPQGPITTETMLRDRSLLKPLEPPRKSSFEQATSSLRRRSILKNAITPQQFPQTPTRAESTAVNTRRNTSMLNGQHPSRFFNKEAMAEADGERRQGGQRLSSGPTLYVSSEEAWNRIMLDFE